MYKLSQLEKQQTKQRNINRYRKYCNCDFVSKNNVVYSCILNQTDISKNKNKFYIMHLVSHNIPNNKNNNDDDNNSTNNTEISSCVENHQNKTNYIILIRYGRVGEIGRILFKEYSEKSDAIKSFEQIFRSKTANKWSNKENFIKKQKKYYLCQISNEKELIGIKNERSSTKFFPKSKLQKKTYSLISMLSDVSVMKNTLVKLNVDPNKIPLGQLGLTQINDAFMILNDINNIIDNITKNNVKLSEDLKNQIIKLSSKYYTYIPFVCGRKKPPTITSKQLIKKYKQILTNLRNIIITSNIVNENSTDSNPIDSIYDSLNTKIKHIKKNSLIWNEIFKYIKNTHGLTHNLDLELIDVFEVSQINKKEIFEKHCIKMNNKKLLFHGTPQSCILSILQKDFYIDPTKLNNQNVKITGKMFSKGIYFADMVSKSFNYTEANLTDNIGCLFLAQVALGNTLEKIYPDKNLTKEYLIKNGYHSVMGIGEICPTSETCINNIVIPNGKAEKIRNNTYLKYNEYVVYDINQILIKYLVLVKNKSKSRLISQNS